MRMNLIRFYAATKRCMKKEEEKNELHDLLMQEISEEEDRDTRNVDDELIWDRSDSSFSKKI